MMKELQVHLLKIGAKKKRKTFPNKIWSLKKSSYLCTRFWNEPFGETPERKKEKNFSK
ncbi:MAG: hypothetical protein PHX26_11660 [Proteiniphilum sp.]|nr:hypothetical protein [Proteiniphilum sp.]